MAVPYARELKRIGHRDRGDLSYIGAVLRCFAYSDLEQGEKLMIESFPWIAGMWDQKRVFDFCRGAWTVCHQLAKKKQTIQMELPENISCYQKEGVYSVSELERWLYGQAKDIAGRFDKRNGSDTFSVLLELAMKEPEGVQ